MVADEKLHQIIHAQMLPISAVLEPLVAHLQEQNNLVLQAEPGAGKTTVVPLALLPFLSPDRKLILLEPRRLAAKNAASRLAQLLGEKLGGTVGLRMRDQVSVSNQTCIEVVTEGVLTRMLQSDPELPDIGFVVFDEFHERSLDADLSLALCLEVQQTLRDDLKLVVMSATLDCEPIAKLMDNTSVLFCEGRSFPVAVEYLPPASNQSWLQPLMLALKRIFDTQGKDKNAAGDVLVFLPGIAEIKKAESQISQAFAESHQLEVKALYGDLPFEQQQSVLRPIKGRRRIILSTNIAETSVTIEGIGFVVDSGLERQAFFDPNVGFNRLRTVKISRASAEQRAGRAGRLSEGHCFRLWQESESLRNHTQPQIMRSDLAPMALELAQWGAKSPSDLALLDYPQQGSWQQATSLLRSIDALNQDSQLTAHGRQIHSLPTHPRIAHMLLASLELRAGPLACQIAALLEAKDPLRQKHSYQPDFLSRIDWLQSSGKRHGAGKTILRQAARFEKLLRKHSNFDWENMHRCENSRPLAPLLLADAFPDRIAQKRGNGYRLANGSGAQLREPLWRDDQLLVVVESGGQSKPPTIFLATAVESGELENHCPHLFETRARVDWHADSQRVEAVEEYCLGQLVLAQKKLKTIPAALRQDIMLTAVQQKGIAALPWTKAQKQLLARVALIRSLPEESERWPDLSASYLESHLKEWLGPFLDDVSRFDQINSELLNQALFSLLPWNQQQRLDEALPEKLRVASGSNVSIDYLQGDTPVLAVKLQEMFGQQTTPKLAQGRIPLLVHLLSPARRPLQVTRDLASFWQNGYEAVKKEMRGRYPKHPWPDDPASAEATALTKKALNKRR